MIQLRLMQWVVVSWQIIFQEEKLFFNKKIIFSMQNVILLKLILIKDLFFIFW